MSWNSEPANPKLKLDAAEGKALIAFTEQANQVVLAKKTDRVTFIATHTDGERKAQAKNGACYADITSRNFEQAGYLNDWTIDSVTPADEAQLSREQVFQFMQDLTQHDLIPEGVTIEETGEPGPNGRKQMNIVVPSHKKNEQLTYFGVCAARWARCYPQLIDSYLKIRVAKPELSAYQIMPVVCGTHAPADGHSPLALGYGTGEGNKNPFMYAALATWALHPDSLDSRNFDAAKQPQRRLYLNTQISALAGQMRQAAKVGGSHYFEHAAHIFHPRFTEFFTNLAGATKEDIQKNFLKLIASFIQKETV